jgi:hypothetical protein
LVFEVVFCFLKSGSAISRTSAAVVVSGLEKTPKFDSSGSERIDFPVIYLRRCTWLTAALLPLARLC